jgi:predicted aminopeptidase
MKRLLLPSLTAMALFLGACASPAWYTQAVSGHVRLMKQREDVQALLASGELEPGLDADLRLALDLRSFAERELSLEAGGSYRQFVNTGQQAVTWNVVAAREFSLEPRKWCFLVSGCVPYRGYFDRVRAEAFGSKLAAKHYDVSVSPAIAYSTLGWFEDPLLDTMLQYEEVQLAAFLFHEIAHQTLYVRGDTAFSESYASFIEETGVRLWLESRSDEAGIDRWRRQEAAAGQFRRLLRTTRTELITLYESGAAAPEMRQRKRDALVKLDQRYQALVDGEWGGTSYYASWFARGVNNAALALIDSYERGHCAFAALYREAQGDMHRFQQLATERARLAAAKRREWLAQECGVIASGDDL